MLVIVFTYNRRDKLKTLLKELPFEVLVIDDGSDYSKDQTDSWTAKFDHPLTDFIRTIHEGKQGFWKKWLLARQIALGSEHDTFCFLPDDVSNVDIEAIKEIASQNWSDRLYALNLLNCGEHFRWGKYVPIQEPFELAGRTWSQCDYVDGAFITNRVTLEAFDIDPVPKEWFDRPDKSSGVGYQMTMKLRALGCPMMLPDKSLAYHGDHESVMHPEHREQVKLITK